MFLRKIFSTFACMLSQLKISCQGVEIQILNAAGLRMGLSALYFLRFVDLFLWYNIFPFNTSS